MLLVVYDARMNAWMLVWMAIAGATGTLARYGLQGLVQARAGTFPWGTLVVNIAGTLAFGLVWGLIEDKIPSTPSAPAVRMVVLIGFMGAFTTFCSRPQTSPARTSSA